jgi:DNA uptake protein ComE-like DNA-binding protein
MVQPLQDIIDYKRKIGRYEDVDDLRSLLSRGT